MKKKLFSIVFILIILSSMFSLNAFAAEMADGTYEVDIALWHSEDDKESMAASAIGSKATVEVVNGVKTMHIESGEMSMLGMKASLQELRIADKNGNFTDAKVESKNAEGNPTGFYFIMPHTDEYITVKVNPHLAIMGNKDIGARIKVDYSTLKLIKSAEPTTAAESETTVIQTVDENGETVEAFVTVASTDNVSEENYTLPDGMEFITEAETQASDAQSKGSGKIAIFVAAAAVATAVIFIVIKKKAKK